MTHHCGNKGHIARHCILLRQSQGPQPATYAPGYPRPNADARGTSLPLPLSPVSSPDWVLDSGASVSLTNDRSLFVEFSAFHIPQPVLFGNGGTDLAEGSGVIVIPTQYTQLRLENVLYVPALVSNLLSLPALVDSGISVAIGACSPTLTLSAHNEPVATASLRDGVYMLDYPSRTVAFAATADSAANLWHRKLGHTNFGRNATPGFVDWLFGDPGTVFGGTSACRL